VLLAPLVLQVRHQIKVGRIAAPPVFASVVHLLFAWNVSVIVAENHQMHGNGLPVQAHAAIPTTSPFA